MCEWLKQAVLKTAVRETVPGVRIPLPPPRSLDRGETFLKIAVPSGNSASLALELVWTERPIFTVQASPGTYFSEEPTGSLVFASRRGEARRSQNEDSAKAFGLCQLRQIELADSWSSVLALRPIDASAGLEEG